MPIDVKAVWYVSQDNIPFNRENQITWVPLDEKNEKCQDLNWRVQHEYEKGAIDLKIKPPEIAFLVR